MSPEKETKIDEIVEELQKRILRGFYVAGQRLPSEREVAEELNVSRVTIRSALRSFIPAGNEIGTKMNIDPDVSVLRRYRVHLVDRVPYRILDSDYLASLLGDLLGQDEGYIPLFKWLREHSGVKAAHAKERLNCRMPSAEEASLLNISRGQPVIDMDRWVWGDDKMLFEYTHIVANGALHEFAYAYDLDEEAST